MTSSETQDDAGHESRPEPAVLELGFRDLVRLGLISNRGMVVVAATLAILLERVDFIDVWDLDGSPSDVERVSGTLESLPELLQDRLLSGESLALNLATIAGAVVLLGLVALAILYLLSISLAVLRFYGFRLERRGEDLRTESGLLTRVAVNTPRHRIQRLYSRETLLHRLFRRLTVRIDTAGGTGRDNNDGDDAPARARQWLAPILERSRRAELVRTAMPEIDPEPTGFEPIAFQSVEAQGPAAGDSARDLLLAYWPCCRRGGCCCCARCRCSFGGRDSGFAIAPGA